MSKVLVVSIVLLGALVLALLASCDAAGPVAAKPPGCAHDTIEVYVGQPLPDSLVITCHPLPIPR